jgi:RES domain-containing protein
MIVYRLSRRKYEKDLSGKGAKIAGGRWNSKGTSLLYTAQSRALCSVEIAVHVPFGVLPKNYKLLTIEFPDTAKIKTLSNKELPSDWKENPHPNSTQQIGDEFAETNEYLVLKVPSAVVQGDYNYLLNPNYSDYKKVEIVNTEPFKFDSRLFKTNSS